jgi:hypothetical protein
MINFGWLNDDEDTLRWRDKLYDRLRELIKGHITPEVRGKWPSIPPEIWALKVDDAINVITGLFEEA